MVHYNVAKAKLKITKDVTQLVLARRTRMCNFLEYKDSKVVYRRYASLFFVTGISQGDNELVTLEIIHRYVEVLDRYFGNVCELDLIFNFQKAYAILDELIIAGEMQESSKKSVLRTVSQSDAIEEAEQSEDVSLAITFNIRESGRGKILTFLYRFTYMNVWNTQRIVIGKDWQSIRLASLMLRSASNALFDIRLVPLPGHSCTLSLQQHIRSILVGSIGSKPASSCG